MLWLRLIVNEIDDVSIDIRLLAFPSARGIPPPEVLSLLDIYGVVYMYSAVRSFLLPRFSSPPEGSLCTLAERDK